MNKNEFFEKMSMLLCPPGDGVFTVNTAKDRKEQYQKVIYPDSDSAKDAWIASIQRMFDEKKPLLLGVCSDTGGGILRGANWGPLFLRSTLLEEYGSNSYLDIGDIRVIPHLLHDKYLNQKTIDNCRKALYGDSNKNYPVSPLSITEEFLTDLYSINPSQRVFSIGGDHSVSYPLTRAFLREKKKQNKKIAIIHFDAHTDLLVERLGIDLCFGSWCTHILDLLPKPDHLIQIGIRSSGKTKEHWQKTFGIKQYWANDCKELGATKLAQLITTQLKSDSVDELYVSFDIDALDESFAGSTGTPEPNGLTPDFCLETLKYLNSSHPITGADMVEIAPFLNTNKNEENQSVTTLKSAALISKFLLSTLAK